MVVAMEIRRFYGSFSTKESLCEVGMETFQVSTKIGADY